MKNFKKNILDIIEDTFGTDSKVMVYSLAGAFILIFSMGFWLGGESVAFLGVAESREININFEQSVEIKTIHVQPGQKVAKGEILLELNQGDIETRLRSLKSQVDKINAELKLREKLARLVTKKKLAPAVGDPLRVDRSQLFREIGYLENQKRQLFVFSEIDGIVGAVNFKAGEKAPAFASLITISPVNPSYIVGYVHESAHNKLAPKQRVRVISPASGKEVFGEVVTVGARIVQIPERLLRITTIIAFGREVLIKVPEENGFLLSEKVQIKPVYTLGMFATAQADDSESRKPEYIDVSLPYDLTVGEMFEPSGMIWIPELANFAVASDEAVGNGEAALLMVGKDGRVSDQTLEIENLGRVDDLESISTDGQSIYVLGSLANTKKGERDGDREVFARLERDGVRLKAVQSVNLRTILEAGMTNVTGESMSQISTLVSQGQINIEGHAVRDGDLYLALKAPQLGKNRGVILKLDNVEKVLAGKTPKVTLHNVLKFKTDKTGFNMQMSDLIMTDKGMLIATTCQGEACSALWEVGTKEVDKPRLVAFFKKRQLEGIAYDSATNTVTGIFDQGGKPTQMVRIKLK